MVKKNTPVVINYDNSGKIPPQNIEVEEAVLGAIMLDKEAIEAVYNLLRPESFYKDCNQKIYSAIISLYSENKPIDILTVTDQLRKDNLLDDVGGPFYVTQLSNKVSTSQNILYHAQIVAQSFFKREMIKASSQLGVMSFDDSVDVMEIIDFAGREFDNLSNKVFGSSKSKSFKELVNDSLDQYYKRMQLFNEGKVSGIKTSTNKLTAITSGWQNGDLIVVAARPSMGKTAVLLSEAKAASENGAYAAIFSLEMQAVRLVDRIICGEADIDPERFRAGNLFDADIMKLEVAANAIYNRNIYIDDNSGVTIHYIKNRARIEKKKADALGIKFIILIDYLQLVDSTSDKGKNREQEVAEISKSAKGIAKELDCPVILLAQLNRSCELRAGDKRPMMSDLRESGAIEQDADLIIMLYRAAYYGFMEDQEGNSTEGKGEFIIVKQRAGRTGTVLFNHNPSLTRIFDPGTSYLTPSIDNAF